MAAAPRSAWALNLTPNAQVGVSRFSTAGEKWRVWAARSDNVLISGFPDPNFGFVWQTHTAAGIAGPTSQGVSATSWLVGGAYQQRA